MSKSGAVGLTSSQIKNALNTGDEILQDILRENASDPLQAFTDRLRDQLSCESCAVFLVVLPDSGKARVLELVSESNENGRKTKCGLLPIQSAVGGGLTGHLAHEGKIAVLSGKALLHNRYLTGKPAKFLTNRMSYSLLGFPPEAHRFRQKWLKQMQT